MESADGPEFTVQLHLTDAARALCGFGVPTPRPALAGAAARELACALPGDYLRVEGLPALLQIDRRVWHVMSDLLVLKLVLDEPTPGDDVSTA